MERILNDSLVAEAVKKLGLAADVTIACDPWMAGADRDSDQDTHKYIQGFLYALAPGKGLESNQYAYPLPFSPVLDQFLGKVVRLDPMGSGGREDGHAADTAGPKPMDHCVPNEYHASIMDGDLRKDLKPLSVVQPEGPSYTVQDKNLVCWQKWRFRVGFNHREGMTIHDVRYDGRPIFYRLSVSEMTVPYGGGSSPLAEVRQMSC